MGRTKGGKKRVSLVPKLLIKDHIEHQVKHWNPKFDNRTKTNKHKYKIVYTFHYLGFTMWMNLKKKKFKEKENKEV